MEYRQAVYQDLEKITGLIEKAIAEMNSHDIHQWDYHYPTATDFEEDLQQKCLYVAIQDDALAAVYAINGHSDDDYDKCRWQGSDENAYVIHRFCVSPDFQHRGIGRLVLQHIENQLRRMGACSIRLDVFSLNPYAMRLYENDGFIKRGLADWRMGRFYLMEKILVEEENNRTAAGQPQFR